MTKTCNSKYCDQGYIFDTLHTCPECDQGRVIQHLQDQAEVIRLTKKLNALKQKIKKHPAKSAA